MKNFNNNEIENFKRSIKVIARAMLPDFPQTDGQGVDEEILKLLTTFRASTNVDEMELSMDEAVKQFQEWLLSNYVRPGMSETEFLSISIERSVGNEKVTLSLGSHFAIGSGAGRSVSYDRLIDAINIEFDRYIRDRLPSQQAQPGVGQTSGSRSEVWVDVERLDVEVKSGKRYFKVKGGQWQQHGVNYWPETMKAHGRVPANIPLEGIALPGYKMLVEMDGNNPKRVLQLVKNG